MKLKNKLKVYESYLSPESIEGTIEKLDEPIVPNQQMDIPHLQEWQAFDVKPYFVDDQYCLIREKHYPLQQKRGKYSFLDYLRAVEAWQHVDFHHPLSTKGFKPTDLFFFDTETTGLGGGVGNTIFLLGYAYVEGEEVIVKQHLLPEPSGEIPLYDSFLRSIDYTTLVTFNGKAFDWPQVKTRHTLIREHVPKLPAFGHFDLLHAARRIWKHQLDSVKLSVIEKEVLNIEREDDVPGYLAPMIYFDFMESKNLDGIKKIMEHNEDDVLSLLILYTHLSFQLLNLDHNQTKTEKIYVGKWYSSLNETDKAIQNFEEGLKNFQGQEKWKGLFDLGMQYKKQKKLKEAETIWLKVIESGSGIEKIKACIEVAKIYEHLNKDSHKALQVSLHAIEEYKKEDNHILPVSVRNDLIKRVERLERKAQVFPR